MLKNSASSPSKRPNISLIQTEDGSYSLNLAHSEDLSERMHHSKGAYTESLYIYNEALKLSLQTHEPAKIMSVGLGLAYNEIISLCQLKSSGINNFYMESFESEPWLVEQLLAWHSGHASELSECYNKLLILLEHTFSFPKKQILGFVHEALDQEKWIIQGALPPNNSPDSTKFNLILYDMFSNKMNPHYWTEEFLSEFLFCRSCSQCVFSTYAATGALKRALKSQNFELIKRLGFAGKRNSTLAKKGYFNA